MTEHVPANGSEPRMDWLGAIGAVLVGLIGVALVGHAVCTRTAHDFLWHTVAIALVILAIIAVVAIAAWSKTGFKRPILGDLFSLALMALAMGFAFYAVGVSVKDGLLFLREFSHTEPGTDAWLAFGTLLIGLTLYALRYYFRAAYGLAEALVGVWIAYTRFAPPPPGAPPVDQTSTAFYLTLLTAALYLMVRGFDNIQQGLTKDPIDKFSSYVLERILRHSQFVPKRKA